ncbi:MAG: ABC transporter ATP-binding protein [Clostridia bacterium]|nr:ABC transporter ATP-binding protein [Clostridia bacterium]
MKFENLLSVRDLVTQFKLDDGILTAVDHVSFDIGKGETLGVVGESGCGKSVTAFSILNLISPPGKVVSGEIMFDGDNLLKKSKRELKKIRGEDIAMIFQEPMTSLNPVYTVGNQIDETLRLHKKLSRSEAKKKTIELLELVNIPLPEQRYSEYPHQLSGGMRQRVMIAMALACDPKLLICDEPTTALDVTVQAQILKLINKLKKQLGMSVMLITHDLAVISEVADRIIVMYAGRIVEECDERGIFVKPLHPYTEALLKSIPHINKDADQLYMIRGMVPNLLKKNVGCMFAPRCEYATDLCREIEPELLEVDGRKVRCHKYTDKWEGNK